MKILVIDDEADQAGINTCNIDKTELLPFKKICQVKYDKMNLPFAFGHLPEPSGETMQKLEKILRFPGNA